MGSSTPMESDPTGKRWFVPDWLDEAAALPAFEVIDTRSAQGRLDPRPKTVTIADLVLLHGHVCDGLLRGAYALRALADVAFAGRPFDRTDLLVVSKNSPCLGDIAAYLTGGRARFGTHRLDDSLGVGFVVQQLSTGDTWEVREEPGFFPPLIAAWDAAVLDDRLVEDGLLDSTEKAQLVSINEAEQWHWVRTELLPSRPADHYVVRTLDAAELPDALHAGRRTDILNRDISGPCCFPSPYEPGPGSLEPGSAGSALAATLPEQWRERYLAGLPNDRDGHPSRRQSPSGVEGREITVLWVVVGGRCSRGHRGRELRSRDGTRRRSGTGRPARRGVVARVGSRLGRRRRG